MNTGKFIASVSVNGRALDSAGNIINRDPHGYPTMWLNVVAGSIPNRQTLTGSVVRRMGVPMDQNGVIAPGATSGDPFSQRLIYGQWLHQSDHEVYGPQFTWSMIKDMTNSSPVEIEESCQYLGAPTVFTVERPDLPEDYQRKTTQHIGLAKSDPRSHSTTSQQASRPAQEVTRDQGHYATDSTLNPELEVHGSQANPAKRPAPTPMRDQSNPDDIIS